LAISRALSLRDSRMGQTSARILALLWATLVIGLHSIPRARLREWPGGMALTSTSWLDKLAHIILFGVLAASWRHAFVWRSWRLLGAGLAFGIALEIYQEQLVSGRSGSVADVAADAVGLLIGLWLARGVTGRRSTHDQEVWANP
jgi:VanZ like family